MSWNVFWGWLFPTKKEQLPPSAGGPPVDPAADKMQLMVIRPLPASTSPTMYIVVAYHHNDGLKFYRRGSPTLQPSNPSQFTSVSVAMITAMQDGWTNVTEY